MSLCTYSRRSLALASPILSFCVSFLFFLLSLFFLVGTCGFPTGRPVMVVVGSRMGVTSTFFLRHSEQQAEKKINSPRGGQSGSGWSFSLLHDNIEPYSRLMGFAFSCPPSSRVRDIFPHAKIDDAVVVWGVQCTSRVVADAVTVGSAHHFPRVLHTYLPTQPIFRDLRGGPHIFHILSNPNVILGWERERVDIIISYLPLPPPPLVPCFWFFGFQNLVGAIYQFIQPKAGEIKTQSI